VRTVLVVEDERDLRELLRRYLEREAFSVLTAGSGAEALALLSNADLVVLDLGLPDIDGLDVLRAAGAYIPVIVLTARSSAQDRIEGLRLGADDYVIKPFSPTELVLRVKAVLRRAGRPVSGTTRSFQSGRLVIDEEAHEARFDGEPLPLTVSEWGVLVALASAPRRVFSRLELANRIHGYEFGGYERSIDSHVKNLRHKLGPTGAEMIETITGVGYRLGVQADE
jgi:DNA-binding response OmpR family regulator